MEGPTVQAHSLKLLAVAFRNNSALENVELYELVGDNHDYQEIMSTCAMFRHFQIVLTRKYSVAELLTLAKTVLRQDSKLEQIQVVDSGNFALSNSPLNSSMIASAIERNKKITVFNYLPRTVLGEFWPCFT